MLPLGPGFMYGVGRSWIDPGTEITSISQEDDIQASQTDRGGQTVSQRG